MSVLLLLCALVGAAHGGPNTEYSIGLYSGKGFALYNMPTPVQVYTSLTNPYPEFNVICDDAAAGPVPVKTIFNITLKTYTGRTGTTCAALFPNGTIAAMAKWIVKAANFVATHASSVVVGEPLSITFHIFDSLGNPVTNPDETFSPWFTPRYGGAILKVEPLGYASLDGDSLLFNNSVPTFLVTFNSPGFFRLVDYWGYATLNSTVTVLPTSGPVSDYFFAGVPWSECKVDENCSLVLNVYNFADGTLATTYNGTVTLSTNGGSQVVVPAGTFQWPANKDTLRIPGFFFHNFTGSWISIYTVTFTDIDDANIFTTLPVFVGRYLGVFTAPQDVSVGDSFVVTYTAYAGPNTLLDGSRYPQEQCYMGLNPYIGSPILYDTTYVDPNHAYFNASGQCVMIAVLNVPGIFTIGDSDFQTAPITVHPKSGGVTQPMPDYVIMLRLNQILIDTMFSSGFGLTGGFYFGANGTSTTLPGNMTITSNDPSFVPKNVQLPSYIDIPGRFSTYTGAGAQVTLSFTSLLNSSWSQTYNIYTYPYLSFVTPPARVQPTENFTITVLAGYPNGTRILDANDRVHLSFSTYLQGFAPIPPSYGGEISMFASSVKYCKPMVNGQVSFTVSICTEGYYQIRAQHCDFYSGYSFDPYSDIITVGNPPMLSQLGLSLLPPAPTNLANCIPADVPTLSPAPSTTGSPRSSGSSIKWYIPVAAVLGGLVVIGAIAALAYFLVIKRNAKDDYIVRA